MKKPTGSAARRRVGARLCRGAMALIAACACGLSGGCREDDGAASAAIADVSRQLTALNAGTGAPSAESMRESVYRKAVERLQPLSTQGRPATQAAAKRLLANALVGQGALRAERAAAIGRDAQATLRQIEGIFDRRLRQLALAKAIAAYDPSREREALQKDIAEKEATLARAGARRGEIESEISQLQERSGGLMQTGRSLREEEGRRRAQALEASSGERVSIVEQVVEVQRRADDAERQAGLLDAKAARRTPDLEAIDREIERLTNQREFLKLALQEIEARAAAGKEQSEANVRLADEAGAEVAALAAEVDRRITEDLIREHDAAMKALDGAARNAKGLPGAGDERTVNQTQIARIAQARADALLAQALTLDAHAAVLARLAEADAPLEGAEGLREAAKKAGAAAAEARKAGREALNEASEAFASAGGKAGVGERLLRASDELKKIAGVGAGAEDADRGGQDEAGAAQGADDAAPAPVEGEQAGEPAPPDESQAPAEEGEQPSGEEPMRPEGEGDPQPAGEPEGGGEGEKPPAPGATAGPGSGSGSGGGGRSGGRGR